MSKKVSRRRVPVSAIAIVAFAVLVLFEVLVIAGALQIRSTTVARIAPWAYEPFLRLVGEHPESETLKESARERSAQGSDAPSGMAAVAGFHSEDLTIDLESQMEESAAADAETAEPAATASNAVPAGSAVTNPVPDHLEEVVPVG